MVVSVCVSVCVGDYDTIREGLMHDIWRRKRAAALWGRRRRQGVRTQIKDKTVQGVAEHTDNKMCNYFWKEEDILHLHHAQWSFGLQHKCRGHHAA